MIGRRVLPPAAGSPLRRRCSSSDFGTAFRIMPRTPRHRLNQNLYLAGIEIRQSRPRPSRRQSFFTLGSDSRPRPRNDARTASQTSSQAAERSTACRTNSSVKLELQFANDQRDRRAAIHRHDIAAAHLTLDLEAQPFEEALYRRIKARLQRVPPTCSPSERLPDIIVGLPLAGFPGVCAVIRHRANAPLVDSRIATMRHVVASFPPRQHALHPSTNTAR